MSRLHQIAIRRPILTVLLAAALVAVVAPGAGRLRLRTDGLALVPPDSPAVAEDQRIREIFGIEDPLIILIRSPHPDGIFNPGTLRLVVELTAELEAMAEMGAGRLFSLATELSFRHRPRSIAFRPLLDPFPHTPAQLDELRADLGEFGIYDGTLVSFDGTATSIQIGVPPGVDRIRLCAAVDSVITTCTGVNDAAGETPGPDTHQIAVIGAPVAEALLGSHILQDLGVPDAWIDLQPEDRGRLSQMAPSRLYSWRVWIGKQVGLVPLAILLMALVFLLGFRSAAAVLLPLTEVGACLLFVFGLMGWMGVPIYLTIAVLPVILTAIAVADEVHIFTRVAEARRAHPGLPVAEAVRIGMDEMVRPVVKTSLTTAIGFLSFSISPIIPVRTFGILMAIGILFCMLWSLTVIPALLVLLRPRVTVPRLPALGGTPLTWLHRRRVSASIVIAIALLLVALVPTGIQRLQVQDSWIDGFAPDSAFRQATRFFNQQFLGTHVLLASVGGKAVALRGVVQGVQLQHRSFELPAGAVDTLAGGATQLVGCRLTVSRPDTAAAGRLRTWRSRVTAVDSTGDNGNLVLFTPRRHGSPLFMLQPAADDTVHYEIRSQRMVLPEVLARIERFEEFVAAQRELRVGGALGPARYLKTANYVIHDRQEEARRIPDDPEENRRLWNNYGRMRGSEHLREALGPDLDRAAVAVFLENANFVDTARLIDRIRDYEAEHLAPAGLEVEIGGDVAVSQSLIEGIVTTQVGSLLVSLVGILLVTSLLHRSFVWGLYCVVPCAVAVAVNFAVMGWIGMPLGVATSMFAGMTLGIGVDFGIHLVERYRLGIARGMEREVAITDAIRSTGPAILIDGLAVAIGFGVLVLSQVPANARLGGLTVVCILSCLVATLLLLPALIRLRAPRPRLTGSRPAAAAPRTTESP